MNSNDLFHAFSYVEDSYLDLVDTQEREEFEMTFDTKRPLRKKSVSILIAAALAVSLLATTAFAAGWIPGIFAAMKDEAPLDEALYHAAAEANTNGAAEIRDIPQLDLTKFTLFEKYYDGETVLLGYDLSGVIPEPVVGYVPTDEDWTSIQSGNDIGVMSSEAIIYWQSLPTSERDLLEDLSDSCKAMALTFQGMLSPEEYEKAVNILKQNGSICVMTKDLWVGDHILINGHEIIEVLSEEVWNMRYDYDVAEGSCIKLNPLPQAGINQDEVTVTLNIRSCEQYWYMDLDGTATVSTGNHETTAIDFVLENVNK